VTTLDRSNYRWPAEWESHLGTLLSWPHKRESWPGKFEPIPYVYERLVKTLAEVEQVHILAADGLVLDQANQLVGNINNVFLHPIPTNDAWARDHGPTFLTSTTREPWRAIDWKYNAWGGKYPPWDDDDAVPMRLSTTLGFELQHHDIYMEGGAIDGNGNGLVLTTSQCLLNDNRNPNMSQLEVEKFLKHALNADKVLWLDQGIEGDDTDGHIDELARFVSANQIVAALDSNHADANYEPLNINFEKLQQMTDQHGNPLEVIALPMPQPKYVDDQRLPASYCNFYIANEIVIAPQFRDAADQKAVDILKDCFPTRNIVPMDALDLVWGLGAFHCITQQIMH